MHELGCHQSGQVSHRVQHNIPGISQSVCPGAVKGIPREAVAPATPNYLEQLPVVTAVTGAAVDMPLCPSDAPRATYLQAHRTPAAAAPQARERASAPAFSTLSSHLRSLI